MAGAAMLNSARYHCGRRLANQNEITSPSSATVIVPANAGLAIEMLTKTIQSGVMPPERTFTDVRSYPSIEEIVLRRKASV